MNNATGRSAGQRQRTKAVLIPILGLVLVAVLFWPAPATPSTPADPQPNPAAQVRTALVSGVSAAKAASADGQWPPIDLPAIMAVNPFARPPAIQRLLAKPANPSPLDSSPLPLSGSAPPDLQPSPAGPQVAEPQPDAGPPPVDSVKLQAILASDGGRTALIDSRIVNAGERLPSGYRVVEIMPTGIVLEYVAADGQPQPAITRSLP